MKEQKELNVKQDIIGWGFGLTFMGILHFFIPALASVWGGVLIAVGVLCMAVQHRGLYILIGLGLMAIGVLNFLGGVAAEEKFWSIYGVFQVYWGVKEMIKFRKCRPQRDTPASADEGLTLVEDKTA